MRAENASGGEPSGDPTERTSRRWVLVAAVIAALAVAGVVLVARARRDDASIGRQPGAPLVIVLSPDHGRALSSERRERLAQLIGDEADLVIEVRVAASPLDAIEAFAGAGDVGLLNLFEYLLARKEYRVEAGLRVVREGGSTYAGELVVPAGSAVQAPADLAGRPVAYVTPYSSSGFVFPASLLARGGVAVEAVFAGS